MPKIQAPAGKMTVQEATRRLIRDGLAASSSDSVATVLRTACVIGDLPYEEKKIGLGKRVAKLVSYEDVKCLWESL